MVLTIGLVYNIKKTVNCGNPDISAEYDDENTVSAIRGSLEGGGHSVAMIEADLDVYSKLRSSVVDIVFNIAEGLRGESRESHVPVLCEMLGIPYTGSGPLTLAICLNKARTKEILNQYNIPTAKHQVFRTPEDRLDQNLKYPLIVKPLHEGSSIGVGINAVVKNNRELVERVCHVNMRHKQPALVEKFLPGREFTVAVIGNKIPRALPVVEVYLEKYPRKTKEVYSFEAKTRWENDSLSGPMLESDYELETQLQKLAINTHLALDCKDFSRVDIRMDENSIPHVIEINPLPGLNPRIEAVSYFPKAARMADMSYDDLINEILVQGLERYNLVDEGGVEDAVESRVNI